MSFDDGGPGVKIVDTMLSRIEVGVSFERK
jgi:hypothetical protein